MALFRKKPVVVAAVKVNCVDYNKHAEKPFDGTPFSEVPDWVNDAIQKELLVPHDRGGTDYAQWDIHAPVGVMTAQPDDWIIKGSNGGLYPCKSDVFAKTYERVE